MILSQSFPVYADDNIGEEWYTMVEESFENAEEQVGESEEVMPYTLYVVDVVSAIAKISSSKVGLRADVYCASTVQSITVTFYLQKYNGSSWTNVSSGTASVATNVSSTTKQMTVTGLSSGTYRTKTVTLVRDKYGYSETVTGYSGSLTI